MIPLLASKPREPSASHESTVFHRTYVGHRHVQFAQLYCRIPDIANPLRSCTGEVTREVSSHRHDTRCRASSDHPSKLVKRVSKRLGNLSGTGRVYSAIPCEIFLAIRLRRPFLKASEVRSAVPDPPHRVPEKELDRPLRSIPHDPSVTLVPRN